MSDLSIIIVQKNDYTNLQYTLESIVEFSERNASVKVIVKSYGSKDARAESICQQFLALLDLKHIEKDDVSIYDAMNQAVAFVETKYLMFLNAGDVFARPICNVGSALENGPDILKYQVRVEGGLVRRERASCLYFLRRMLNHQGLIYSRYAFGDGYNVANVVAADLRHIIEYDRYKKISYIDEILVEYLGAGFATQDDNIRSNWYERRGAYTWCNARLHVKLAITIFAFVRLKIRK